MSPSAVPLIVAAIARLAWPAKTLISSDAVGLQDGAAANKESDVPMTSGRDIQLPPDKLGTLIAKSKELRAAFLQPMAARRSISDYSTG
jgi:hypothetical protein